MSPAKMIIQIGLPMRDIQASLNFLDIVYQVRSEDMTDASDKLMQYSDVSERQAAVIIRFWEYFQNHDRSHTIN